MPGTSERVKPEVIATSHNSQGIVQKGVVNTRPFGAIGSYDGHRANVGRVLVDATWHHFFNVNLIGDASGHFPPFTPVGPMRASRISSSLN